MITFAVLYTAALLVGTCIWRAHGLPDPKVPLQLVDTTFQKGGKP